LSRDEAIALAATQQSNEQASVEDMNRLINQGRAYQKLQAQLKAYQEMVKEKDEYISQLKDRHASLHLQVQQIPRSQE
jgi:hypothetical protein